MRTRTKILLILAATGIILLATVFAFMQIAGKRNQVIQDIQNHTIQQTIQALIEARSGYFVSMVRDYSGSAHMQLFVDKPDPSWARQNIGLIRTYRMSVLWVFNKEEKLVYRDSAPGIDIPCMLSESMLNKIRKDGQCHFFVKSPYGILELTGSTIRPPDRPGEAHGLFIAGKLWDSTTIKKIEELTHCRITILDTAEKIAVKKDFFTGQLPLYDINHHPVATLVSFTNEPLLARTEHITHVAGLVLLGSIFLIALILVLGFNFFVLGPLARITSTLKTGNTRYIQKLTDRSDEFGRIAFLIRESFDHSRMLSEEIENRKKAESRLTELNEQLISQKKELQDHHDDLYMLTEELQEQKEEIEEQKNYLAELNDELKSKSEEIAWQRDQIAYQKEELTDSLKYARRIQRAVLPGRKILNHVFPDNFILYLPHSIISGDFYFITEEKGRIIIAAADCTGHGVPGALMSMLGITLLNEITHRSEESNPANILIDLREEVIDAFRDSRHAEESREGMEIGIITIDPENLMMVYAGANLPLYVYRNGSLFEFCPDKIPIGNYILQGNYSNQSFQLQKGDTLYLFSDGYADQLGGPKGGRFKKKLFKQLLATMQKETMHDQKIFLEQNLEEWRKVRSENGGPFEQTDDVLILGVRL